MSLINKNSVGQLKKGLLTVILFSLIIATVLAGADLIGFIDLPSKVQHWIGAVLIGYVSIGGLVVTYLCSQSILNEKE